MGLVILRAQPQASHPVGQTQQRFLILRLGFLSAALAQLERKAHKGIKAIKAFRAFKAHKELRVIQGR